MTDELELEGWAARLQGAAIKACPHQGEDAQRWRSGWRDADALI